MYPEGLEFGAGVNSWISPFSFLPVLLPAFRRAERGLSSQLPLPMILPGCRALPGSRAGGAERTQTPCGLAPIPSSGDHTCIIGYLRQRGYMSCHLRGGEISARPTGKRGSRTIGYKRVQDWSMEFKAASPPPPSP